MGQRSVTAGQIAFGQDFLTHQIGQWRFSGRNKPAAIVGVKQVIGKFGQVTGTEQNLIAYQHRRLDLV